MSEDGKNIVAAVRQMARFHKDIASLLRSVDEGVLARKGWVKHNNVSFDPMSCSILKPADWMPTCVFRVYLNDKMPNLLIYISIILDAVEEGTFEEPLISAGYFFYDSPVTERWEWRYMRSAEWVHAEQEPGTIMPVHVDKVNGAAENGVQEIGLIYLPLMSVKTAADAKDMLIDKVLAEIKKRGLR